MYRGMARNPGFIFEILYTASRAYSHIPGLKVLIGLLPMWVVAAAPMGFTIPVLRLMRADGAMDVMLRLGSVRPILAHCT